MVERTSLLMYSSFRNFRNTYAVITVARPLSDIIQDPRWLIGLCRPGQPCGKGKERKASLYPSRPTFVSKPWKMQSCNVRPKPCQSECGASAGVFCPPKFNVGSISRNTGGSGSIPIPASQE